MKSHPYARFINWTAATYIEERQPGTGQSQAVLTWLRAYGITAARVDAFLRGLPKPYQTDIQLIFGAGTVQFCPEFLIESGTGDAATLKRLREVAPSIAHNADSAI